MRSLSFRLPQADTYFGFMTEAVRLGLAPKVGGGTGWGFKQPSAMSTGMHAVLLAVQLCEEVNVFGFSTSHVLDSAEVQEVTPATDRYFDTPGSRRDSAGVDWDRRVFEARMLQLLHLGQHAALCTH